MKKILFIFGTRPEAIKLAPLINLFSSAPEFNTLICISSQHNKLLQQALNFFNIKPDYDLDIMTEKQSLTDINVKCLSKLESVLKKESPDLVIIQGDTTTAFSAALASFYNKIPIAHVEAGLRTYDNNNPFPEEINRKFISELATYHFAPTALTQKQLAKEGIVTNTWVVGNTIVDALKSTQAHIAKGYTPPPSLTTFRSKKLILVTGHRRENCGKTFTLLCHELIKLAKKENIQILFTLHLNPLLKDTAISILSNQENISLIAPQPYPDFMWLMQQSSLVITDSGGIQEEAPYLGVPVLVTRKSTERMESLSKNCELIDITSQSLHEEVQKLLNNPEKLNSMKVKENLYGNGDTSSQILSILRDQLINTTSKTLTNQI